MHPFQRETILFFQCETWLYFSSSIELFLKARNKKKYDNAYARDIIMFKSIVVHFIDLFGSQNLKSPLGNFYER
jgi:hypothetical protein